MDILTALQARTTAQAAREELARTYFNPDAVAKAISQAVSLGHNHLRIFQAQPVNLADTTAARELCQLLKVCGYTIEWDHTAQPIVNGKRDTMRFHKFTELVISWE